MPAQLTFVGVASCDDRGLLEREIERRSEVLRWVTDATGAVGLEVRLGGGIARFDASVVVKRPGASPVARSIVASTCQEVIEGAALIIAVALTPPEPQRSEPLGEPKDLQVAARAINAPDRHPWSFGVGTTGVVVSGIAPGFLPGVEAFVDVSRYENGWSPGFRASFRYLARSGFDAGEGEGIAGFRLISGVGEVCPLAWFLSQRLVVRPCIAGAFGSLQGIGSADAPARTDSHPWASAGTGLRLEARLLNALSAEFEGAAEVSLFRGRFWYSGVAFHETSRLNGRIGLGLVARIGD